MTKTVAMYEGSYEHIEPKLSGLTLDLDVLTFDVDGLFRVDGKPMRADQLAADFIWLSPHVKRDGCFETAFDVALQLRGLKVLQTFNAGLDDPAYRRIADAGITICNSSAQGIAIAEYVIGQVLGLFQPIAEQREMQTAREWRTTPHREISRTHWLIVGYGPIGSALAQRVKAFGAQVSAIRRSGRPDACVDRVGTSADLSAFLPDADVIVIACPLNDATRGMVGEAFLSSVKPDAILVNVARGGLIDDAALVRALDSGRLGTAVLDVFHTEPLPDDDPLWSHPGVRVTPHTSFAGDGVQDRWDQLFLDNIQRFIRGEELIRVVDPAQI
ncbi:MAG: D-2-hydroxyacid dehydrogenase [Pseudomonadota bacterium]